MEEQEVGKRLGERISVEAANGGVLRDMVSVGGEGKPDETGAGRRGVIESCNIHEGDDIQKESG